MTQEPGKGKGDAGEAGWRGAGLALAIPTMLAACALVGVVLGRLADSWLGTSPFLVLLGLALGLAAGVRETILILRKMNSTRE